MPRDFEMYLQKYFKIPRLSLKNNIFFNFLDFFQKPLANFSGMVYTYFYSDKAERYPQSIKTVNYTRRI